ncbi:hypothetical protein CPB86DRAFT_557113 [Serendipita vermifera]|nr:hypothetical protein CPB86DRAFT_557113 [Serendipita vermifera]
MATHQPLGAHITLLQKGFETLALAATFLAAIQAQVMSISMNTPLEEQTVTISLTNAFFLMGLVLDLMAALTSLLTFRWLQRLSHGERNYLETRFEARSPLARDDVEEDLESDSEERHNESMLSLQVKWLERFIYSWSATSLFIPWLFLVLGVTAMAIGIQIYIWTQQKFLVAILVTLTYVGVLPFLAGVFIIGRDSKRRKRIIRTLSKNQGDW